MPWNFKTIRYRIFYALVLDHARKVVSLGNPEGVCQWNVWPGGLKKGCVVYSGGVGDDVSFEHDLVKQFGCSVVLLDPSPIGLKTMTLPENQITQFHFFPVALAGHKGKLKLGEPEPGDKSWYARKAAAAGIEVSCTDLRSLMEENRHDHIDLLKLDIEGSEYDVIKGILQHRIPVRQICVEYHHGILPGISRGRTLRSILSLIRCGYKLVDQFGNNHTFVRRAA
jgi:FkbM family methyltransferase